MLTAERDAQFFDGSAQLAEENSGNVVRELYKTN